MKVDYNLRGEGELSQRLVALAELPGVDLALDEAAIDARTKAANSLARSGHDDIAESLQISNPAPGIRHLTTTHPAAWHVDAGTTKTPALRWRQAATRQIGSKLKSALDNFLRRRLRKLP